MIKLYTQPGCAACLEVKEYLSSIDADFKEINIQDTPGAAEKLAKKGALATPVLEIGSRMVVGFDREKIDEAIAAMARKKR